MENTIYPSGGILKLVDGNPDDGDTKIEFSAGTVEEGTVFSIRQKDLKDVPISGDSELIENTAMIPVVAYEITGSGNKEFSKAVIINLLYFDLDDDGIVDGTNFNESNLRIFWYDGSQWRHLGGIVDTAKNVITAKINHLTLYGIFPIKNSGLNPKDYAPKEKVITPNGDGKNDYANFNGIQNYLTSINTDGTNNYTDSNVSVKIYDLSNKLIRDLQDTDTWDGKANDGNLAESGIYIYQYVIDGKTVSGTIVLAK